MAQSLLLAEAIQAQKRQVAASTNNRDMTGINANNGIIMNDLLSNSNSHSRSRSRSRSHSNSDSPNVSVAECAAASEFQPRATTNKGLIVDDESRLGVGGTQHHQHQLVVDKDAYVSVSAKNCSCVPNWSNYAESPFSPISIDYVQSPGYATSAAIWNSFYVGQRSVTSSSTAAASDRLSVSVGTGTGTTGMAHSLRVRMPPVAAADEFEANVDDVIENRNASHGDRSFSTDDEYMNSELEHHDPAAGNTGDHSTFTSPSRKTIMVNPAGIGSRGPDLTDGTPRRATYSNNGTPRFPHDAGRRKAEAPPLPVRHDSVAQCNRNESPCETSAYHPEVRQPAETFSPWASIHAAHSLPQEAFTIMQNDVQRSAKENQRNQRVESQRVVSNSQPETSLALSLAKSPSDNSVDMCRPNDESERRKRSALTRPYDFSAVEAAEHPYLRATLIGLVLDKNVNRIHKLIMVSTLLILTVLAGLQVHDRVSWYNESRSPAASPSSSAAAAASHEPSPRAAALESAATALKLPFISFCFDNPLSSLNMVEFDQLAQADVADDERRVESALNATGLSSSQSQPSALEVLTSCASRIPASLYESVTAAMQAELGNSSSPASKRALATLSRFYVSALLNASAHRKNDVVLSCQMDETTCTADDFTYEQSDGGLCLAFQPTSLVMRPNSNLKVTLLIPNYDYLQFIPRSSARVSVRIDTHSSTFGTKSLRNAYQQLTQEVISPPTSETSINIRRSAANAACRDELAICHADCVAQQFNKRCSCHLQLPVSNASLLRETSECNMLMLTKCIRYQTSGLLKYDQIQSYCSEMCAPRRGACAAQYTLDSSTATLQPVDTFSASMNWRRIRSVAQQQSFERRVGNARLIQRWARLSIYNASCFEALRCLADLLMSVEQNTMSSLRLIQKLQQYVTSTTTDPTLSNSLRTSLEDAAQQTHQFITALRGSSYYTAPTITADASAAGPTTLLQFHVRLTGLFLSSRLAEERLQSTVSQFNRIMNNLLTIDVKISEYQSRNIQGYSPSVNTLQNNIGEFRARISRLLTLVNEFDMRAQSLVTTFSDLPSTFIGLHPELRNITDSQYVLDQVRVFTTSVNVRIAQSDPIVPQTLNISAPVVQTQSSTYRYSFAELLCEVGGTIALYYFLGLAFIRSLDFLTIRIIAGERSKSFELQESVGKSKNRAPKTSITASIAQRSSSSAQTAAAASLIRNPQGAAYV